MSILKEGTHVKGYKVATFIKEGQYNDTYKLLNEEGLPFFMKLYDLDKIPSQVVDDGIIREIAVYKNLNHQNIASYITDGSITIKDKEYPYLITEYFTGKLGSEIVVNNEDFSFNDALVVFLDILKALNHMHINNVLHNDITPRNIIIERREGVFSAKIIDFGHVTYSECRNDVITTDMEPLFRATESYYGKWGKIGDIYSIFAVFYAIVQGYAPWKITTDDGGTAEANEIKPLIINERKKRLDFCEKFPSWIIPIIQKGLSYKSENRFDSVDIIMQSIEAKSVIRESHQRISQSAAKKERYTKQDSKNTESCEGGIRIGGGFSDVAGMDDLKSLLQQKVIFLLKNREKAQKYRLTTPNGMLLYGPPGCGKTYFAEKFAEESGFNFYFVKASDLGSIYVHGTQGKIAELFKKAEEESPTIICFDEFDAMAPSRQKINNEGISGEVNEFLTQLNNCSKRRIFVIGTTNQPDLIDNAVLRKGRLDLSIYIPAPDENTRKLMFDINLKDRPCLDIDSSELAKMTDNYVASDIAYIVNDAAMIAAIRDEPISQEDLINSINCTKPSLNEDILKYYYNMMMAFNGERRYNGRRRVGFMLENQE